MALGFKREHVFRYTTPYEMDIAYACISGQFELATTHRKCRLSTPFSAHIFVRPLRAQLEVMPPVKSKLGKNNQSN